MSAQVSITIPLVPPGVNHYVRHTRSGRHYITREAKAFKRAVAIFSRGLAVEAREYMLDVTVYLGKGQRGDGDNFWKVIGDGLKDAGVITSDAAVKDWRMKVDRDALNPRTEIRVSAVGA